MSKLNEFQCKLEKQRVAIIMVSGKGEVDEIAQHEASADNA
jgi:hypothetical protein